MAEWTEQDGQNNPVTLADGAAESTPAGQPAEGQRPAAMDSDAAASPQDTAIDLDAAVIDDASDRGDVVEVVDVVEIVDAEVVEVVDLVAAAPASAEADVTEADDAEPAALAGAADGASLEEPVSDDAAPVPDGLAEINAALDAEDAAAEFRRPAAELKAIVEALIFASPDPLTPKALMKLLDNEPKEDVLAALDELRADYERPGGLQLVEVAGGFQIVTRSDLHEWVRRLFHERSTQKLSVQALETLAVIAYRQPITAIEITEIRGVNTSGVLNTLLERHLVKIVGRKQVVGRPFMYATTKEFLIRFGLKDLGDLPKVEEMAESLGIESSLLVEQTPPEEQLPLSEPEADPQSEALSSDGEFGLDDEDVTDDPEPSVH